MKLSARKTPWYAAGLAFECQQCGNCCAGPGEGFVWVDDDAIRAIAAHLELSEPDVRRRYVRRVMRRLSLVEDERTRDCIFLQRDDDGRCGCAIYPVRPVQCRTWPFWPVNLKSPDAWARAGKRCGGINRGETIDYDTIRTRRDETRAHR
ncbi:MAG: YkgJ family cysteine cluster protein [Phycisphaerae bacterium]|nr:YkgJ family cysteine cluster protein [Phycisphaerae bacterium]